MKALDRDILRLAIPAFGALVAELAESLGEVGEAGEVGHDHGAFDFVVPGHHAHRLGNDGAHEGGRKMGDDPFALVTHPPASPVGLVVSGRS